MNVLAFVPEQITQSKTPVAVELGGLSDLTEGPTLAIKGKKTRSLDAISIPEPPQSTAAQPTPTPVAEQRNRALNSSQPRNPNLDSFEAVMEAMETELEKSRSARKDQAAKGKVKARRADESPNDIEEDIETAMDEELHHSLKRAVVEDDSDEEDTDLQAEHAGLDYNLIKNFMESFRAQGGQSGPVSTLAGRLQPGWTLPRDAADA